MKILAISLILLCCLIGAASAADDVSMDAVDASVDDVVTVDAGDSIILDETPVDAVSDDAAAEVIDEEIQTDEISEGSADADSEQTRSNDVYVSNWADLKNYSQKTDANYDIHLNDVISIGSAYIDFKNSATIIGTPNNYITGGSSSIIPFQSSGDLSITFINVTFKDISASVLLRLATGDGINKFVNCSFDNIHTYAYKSSVIWNDKGYMKIIGCNFTNCNDGFGAITNYATFGTVQMDVENCRFVDNFGRLEPGAINNCGEMNVTNCTFIHNVANWWAGAIHTHTNAHTRIFDSTFTDNVAGGTSGSGWNGGALFSYSDLEVYNSVFTGNNCSVLTGGGAIFGYSMGTSTYNITVDSCNFTNNANNYNGGYAGAIGVQNIGYLTVTNSNFTNNHATYGQAIYGITKDEPYCINCTNCTCPNCPNCTNCTHNVSTGEPNCTIVNNTYLNHTGSGDTVVIDGQRFTFNYNIFINSTQSRISGIGNRYGLTTYPSRLSSPNLSHQILSSPILKDWDTHDVIYINRSREADPEDENIHGSSWDDAYGSAYGDFYAFEIAIPCINEGGTIYIAEGTYPEKIRFANGRSYTMIGMDGTIFDTTEFIGPDQRDLLNYGKEDAGVVTYINITFKNPIVTLRGQKVFINCTFINAPITANQEIYEKFILGDPSAYTIYWSDRTFDFNFTNCNFVNFTTEGAVLEAFATSQVNFNECTFENIAAKSIVNNTGDFICEDSINFKDCVFNNVNVKGIVDVPEGAAFGTLYSIEGCTGVDSFGVVNEEGRDFVNSTQKAETIISAEDLTVEANVAANLTVTLKDADGNALVGKEITVSVDGVNSTVTTVEGGVATIPISYDAEGVHEYTLYFAGDETNYKESTKLVTVTVTKASEPDTPVPPTKVATKLAAAKVTATYNVAKKLVITLTADGKALANKKVTVKVGTISKTLTTNAKGQVSLNVATLVPKTYTATVKFAGDSSYTASTVKPKVVVSKAKVKLAAKAKTFKVKVKTKKYTVTLKNNKGKVLKKVKLTLKVGKKTYKATTNSKGKATFKITKLTKKGKYTATVKFAGSKYYKAISKKVKITVKK